MLKRALYCLTFIFFLASLFITLTNNAYAQCLPPCNEEEGYFCYNSNCCICDHGQGEGFGPGSCCNPSNYGFCTPNSFIPGCIAPTPIPTVVATPTPTPWYSCECGGPCEIVGWVCVHCEISPAIGPAEWRCRQMHGGGGWCCDRPSSCGDYDGCYDRGTINEDLPGCATNNWQCGTPTPTPPPTTPTTPAPISPPPQLPTPPPSRVFCDHSYPPQPVATPPDPNNPRMYTAVGCIPVGSARAFIGWVLLWIVGIAGGIALILIVYAGFMIITSTGNPQRVQAGKELLTAAISGLAVLLFGIFILEFIGFNILNIPGFGI